MSKLDQHILDELSQGMVLNKMKSSIFPPRYRTLERNFFLNFDNMTFYYEGSRFKNKDTCIPIAKILDVRLGENDDYVKDFKKLDVSHCFAVVPDKPYKIMHLKAASTEARDLWVHGLQHAMLNEQLAERQSGDVRRKTCEEEDEVFLPADKNRDGSLVLIKEVMNLLYKL